MQRKIFGLFCVLAGLASIIGVGVVLEGGHYPLYVQVMNALLVSVTTLLYGIYLITGSEPK